jgi:chromosome segregation ATPase
MTITINPRRIPRETLQSLVNTYIDQLYADLDEAHAAVARLSEENENPGESLWYRAYESSVRAHVAAYRERDQAVTAREAAQDDGKRWRAANAELRDDLTEARETIKQLGQRIENQRTALREERRYNQRLEHERHDLRMLLENQGRTITRYQQGNEAYRVKVESLNAKIMRLCRVPDALKRSDGQ